MFFPASGFSVGWPDSIVSASAMPLVTTFYPCRRGWPEHPMLHAPQAGKTNRIRTKRPLYQDGGAHCAAQENHGRFDPPSTLRAPVLDCFAWSDLGGDEPCVLGNHAILEVTPQRNEQSPRQRNDADAAHAQAPAGEASVVPLAERA